MTKIDTNIDTEFCYYKQPNNDNGFVYKMSFWSTMRDFEVKRWCEENLNGYFHVYWTGGSRTRGVTTAVAWSIHLEVVEHDDLLLAVLAWA